ncbi:unnamed protein product, partial [Iphiclides podalirius]
MLLVEAPGEAAGPLGATPLHLPMATLTKLNFTDFSAKVNKQYASSSATERDGGRLCYDNALSARLNYEQSVCGVGKLSYADHNRLAYDPTLDNINSDTSFALPAAEDRGRKYFRRRHVGSGAGAPRASAACRA